MKLLAKFLWLNTHLLSLFSAISGMNYCIDALFGHCSTSVVARVQDMWLGIPCLPKHLQVSHSSRACCLLEDQDPSPSVSGELSSHRSVGRKQWMQLMVLILSATSLPTIKQASTLPHHLFPKDRVRTQCWRKKAVELLLKLTVERMWMKMLMMSCVTKAAAVLHANVAITLVMCLQRCLVTLRASTRRNTVIQLSKHTPVTSVERRLPSYLI